jgi:uncharacterized protein YgiM (DUF1202 family)
MKTNYWLVLATTLSTSVIAQTVTNPAAAAPAAVLTNLPALAQTNAPAAPAAKKSAKKKKAAAPMKSAAAVAAETAIKVWPGPALVVASNVNVRGQAAFNGEVITRLNKGDTVTVLEEVTLEKPKADEPVKWAKIAFPTNAHVWVHASFIDPTNKTVLPNKLNLRAGPGENFSVVGMLQKGDAAKEIITRGDWMQIEAPADAYAFIAAQYLNQEAPAAPAEPAPAVAEAKPPTAPSEGTPAPAESVPAPPTPAPAETPAVTPAPTETPAVTPAPTPAPAEPAKEEPPPKRIVQREGIVRPTWSIQAPTPFALVSADTGETINYLYTTSTNLNLKRYKGLRIVVTGEEGLDARWRNTPVITIQRIHVVE